MKFTFLRYLTLPLLVLFVHVAKGQSEIETISARISYKILEGVKSISDLDSVIEVHSEAIQADGSWGDIDYPNMRRTKWPAIEHLLRVLDLSKGYTLATSSYYENAALHTTIINALEFWDINDPQSDNWYFNEIATPKRLGEILLLLKTGQTALPTILEGNLISQMIRGNPEAQTGANKLDIATHFLYRACLTQDSTLLQYALDQAFEPVVQTTGEGLQYDYSYNQHGPQQMISSYGSVFLSRSMNIAAFVSGTSYSLSGDQLDLLAIYYKDTYLKSVRGAYLDFSTKGREFTRKGVLYIPNEFNRLELAKSIAPAYNSEWDAAIARTTEAESPNYMITPNHAYYYSSDYTRHQRPAYHFYLRTVSSRTERTESGNGENLKGKFLPDGATSIMRSGSEYYNIMPIWEWDKIPGTTSGDFTQIPAITTTWGEPGSTAFVGGVNDSLYGATAYDMNYYDTKAKKSWFFFDDEVVCLGAGINSTLSENIHTTVNQCWLNGEVTVSPSSGGASALPASSQLQYTDPRWVLHDSIGYFFPQGGDLKVSNVTQSGNWNDLNTSQPDEDVSGDVFKMWLDHGAQPSDDTYSYIVVPGMSNAAEMDDHNLDAITIVENTSSIQAVRNTSLDMMQIVFHSAGMVVSGDISVAVNKPCVILLKNVSSSEVAVSIADPTQQQNNITAYLEFPAIEGTKQLTFKMPASPHGGATVNGIVDVNTPDKGDVAGSPNTTVYTTIADAFTRSGTFGNNNYGSREFLAIKADGENFTREGYVKFDLASLPQNIAEAKLKMYSLGSANSITWDIYTVGNDWTETGITANNAPASEVFVATLTGTTDEGFVEWNIKPVLDTLSGTEVSFKIVSTTLGENNFSSFASKEAADPTLVPSIVVVETVEAAVDVVADAFIRYGQYSNNNYGTSSFMVTTKTPNPDFNREAFVKFDLSGTDGNITQGHLQMYSNGSTNTSWDNSWELYIVGNNWTETGITANNAPSQGVLIAASPGTSEAGPVTFDVSGVLDTLTGTVVSFKIVATTNSYIAFASKEDADGTKHPKLIVQFVEPASQVIVFNELEEKTFGDDDFTLTAAGGDSNNPVTFTSDNSDVAIINGNTLIIKGVGTANITANQDGNDDYAPAIPVKQELTVNKASQTITFDALDARTCGEAPFELTASGGASGNAVTFTSSNENVATIVGNTVTIVGVGTTTITANQEGNDNYNAASSVEQELTVDEDPECTPEVCEPLSVIDFSQGKKKNGGTISDQRSDPSKALGEPQENDTYNFVSLGFGGSITFELAEDLIDDGTAEPDFIIVETSFGRADDMCFSSNGRSYPEEVFVEVSIDNESWYSLPNSYCRTSFVDIKPAFDKGLEAVRYIKITDKTNLSYHGGSADGFDVDGLILCSDQVLSAQDRLLNARTVSNSDPLFDPDFFNRAPNEESDLTISVYPNPVTNDKLKFTFNSENDGISNISIFDPSGLKVRDVSFSLSPGQSEQIINMSDLASGIYLYQIVFNENVTNGKVLKQ